MVFICLVCSLREPGWAIAALLSYAQNGFSLAVQLCRKEFEQLVTDLSQSYSQELWVTREILIKGSEPLFTASGDQYGFAALPVTKARPVSPNATNENKPEVLHASRLRLLRKSARDKNCYPDCYPEIAKSRSKILIAF